MPNEKNYGVLPQQQPFKVRVEDSPHLAEAADVGEDEEAMEIRPTILTNDIITTWTEGNPGAVIPWHSHSPEMYQVLVNIEGRCVWEYRDNKGDVQSIEGKPGDIIYLPAGAENRVQVVGDERHTHIGILKRPRVPRIEHLTGELDGLYDPTEFPAALVIDDMNDRVVRKGDDVEL